MSNRWADWPEQAEHDLEQAAASKEDGRHGWVCFAAHQAAEKAVKALHPTEPPSSTTAPSRANRPSIMPVRSSSSSVLRWPDESRVRTALAAWARERTSRAPHLLRVGYFGSYARGDWGPGSDLDVVLVVARSDRPFIERGVEWDLTGLPVPAQPLVYTTDEWARLQREGGRFADVLREETVWVWKGEDRRAQ